MLAENQPGAIAQSTQNDDLEGNLATGLAGSVVGRGISAELSGAGRVINAARGVTPVSKDAAVMVARGGNATEESVIRLANQREPDLAFPLEGLDVRPRADVIGSAERLKIADNLLPSHYSGNQQYKAVEQALKSRAGSALRVQEEGAISSLEKRAGHMIDMRPKPPIRWLPASVLLTRWIYVCGDYRYKVISYMHAWIKPCHRERVLKQKIRLRISKIRRTNRTAGKIWMALRR